MSGSDAEPEPKELRFVASAQKDMRDMSQEIKDGFGYSLWLIQQGETPANASPFEGSTGNDVMKLTEQHDGDTFRCVYAAKFEKVVYVLHVFQKKSKSGIATPKADIDKVHARYAAAKAAYLAEFASEEKTK
jgi:phage-related protein